MKARPDELIAVLLGDAPMSPALRRWTRTPRGARELRAYRATLDTLAALYGKQATPRPVVYWCALSTPIGRVLVAASDAGLVRVSFGRTATAFAAELRETLGVTPVRSTTHTADVVHQLRAYFAGERRNFDVQVDLSRLSSFHRRVLLAASRIPAGQVVSYGDLARRIGQPRGYRAVGQALGHNPVPIVIPCHRIVAAGGRLGGYGGGIAIKKKLLRLEGALAVGD
jgi:methylated-DNA-[protein]-cysteine S-methyltransferase